MPTLAAPRGSVLSLLALAIVLVAGGSRPVALQKAGPATAAQAAGAPRAYDTSVFSALKWRSIGPNRGGRSLAAAGSPSRPNEYYFGAVGGGLWKTTDGGVTWAPVTDGHIRSSSVGAVAVSPSHPDIVYLGMGEVQLRGNVMQGDGVYRSDDGGKSWTHLGLANTHAIGRIRVDPENPDVAYVAALGHTYGPNAERGVFRTRDGGKTWRKVLFRSERAGAVDLCLDPRNPRVLYASIWEVYRTPWLLWSGGEGSGLFKSTDAGDTWTELTRRPGLPKGIIGKIAVSVSGADSERVFALIEAEDGGLFRSDDAGATWAKVNESRDLRQRAFYFSRIYADPASRDGLYVLNYLLHRSLDGGRTFDVIDAPHVDHHDLWIDPGNALRMINSNDGGANVTVNGGRSWTGQRYPTAQLYHVATTRDVPYHVCGAQQDNSTVCVPSGDAPHLHDPESAPGDWFYSVGGNESGYVTPHPTDPNIFYAGGQEAFLTRYDRRTGEARDIQPFPRYYSGQSAASVPERWQWTFPIAVSPLDPKVLYSASQHLWRSVNEGQSWEKISPDLTRADPKTMGDSGGPITKDQNGPEFYATIFAIAPSRHARDTIWVGSDDGRVHVTRDGGKTWANVTPPDMPEFTRVSVIDASPHAPGAAYVAGKRYQLDDRAPYVWKTSDYGRTWTRIVAGIPADDFVHAVREDPVRKGLLYAGTEHGVYVSFDEGARWQSLSLNLPDTQVADLVVEAHDLVIGTHGRSIYVLDDIDPLRQLAPGVVSGFHLFEPRDAVRRVQPGVFYYYAPRVPAGVKAEVIDAAGAVVRALALPPPARSGLQRITWDLRYPGAVVFPGMIMRSAQPGRGPIAPPGRYTLRVWFDGEMQERGFAVKRNPTLPGVTDPDLTEQFALALKIRDKTSQANQAVIRIRGLKQEAMRRGPDGGDRDVQVAARAFIEALGGVEEELYQVKNRSPKDPLNYPIKTNNRLAALQRVVESAEARPTDQSYAVFALLSDELAASLAKLDLALSGELARLNAVLRSKGLPPLEVQQ